MITEHDWKELSAAIGDYGAARDRLNAVVERFEDCGLPVRYGADLEDVNERYRAAMTELLNALEALYDGQDPSTPCASAHGSDPGFWRAVGRADVAEELEAGGSDGT